jgi:hypothetical protein
MVQIPFVFRAEVLQRRHRKPKLKLYRALASVQIETIAPSEATVAYSIELAPHETVNVLLHPDGDLYWPLEYTCHFRRTVAPGALQALATGANNPFSDGWSDALLALEDDQSVKKTEKTFHDEALANVHRKAASCLVVGDRLFGKGGVPIIFAMDPDKKPTLWVTSSGASRYGEPQADELAVGGLQQRLVQWSLARGLFLLPQDDRRSSRMWASEYPRVIALQHRHLDAVDVRMDSMFRMLWGSLSRLGPFPQNDKLQIVYDFCRARIAVDAPAALTADRCEALHSILAVLPIFRNTTSARNIRAMLMEGLHYAARAGVTTTPDANRLPRSSLWTPAENDFIDRLAACLAEAD